MKKKFSTSGIMKIFVFVVMSALAISVIVPVLWVMSASLKPNEDFYKNPWSLPSRLTPENFVAAWKNANMGSYFLNSVTVTALSLALLLLIAVPCAYALSRFRFKFRGILKGLFMAGLFINASYLVVPIFLMLVDANKIIGSPLLLNNHFVLSLVYASTALPFTVYLLSGYFSSLPGEYEEAAYVDGASSSQTMIRIMIPMARPAIITVILFNFLSFWNEYIISLTLLTEDSLKTLPVGLMNLMKAQNAAAQYGRMYAGLVIIMLPTLLLYILLQKKLTEGLAVGGVKG